MKRATDGAKFVLSTFAISIHALVKRATYENISRFTRPRYFNPRPREEGDQSRRNYPQKARHFNPRPREEGDLKRCRRSDRINYFNPRPREEGDLDLNTVDVNYLISIHALVKRATLVLDIA